jgi:CheY-like chemotaxis protein/nitrogen-specific signal transduction histidine kinase/HPt (histidine-containing phosphotransfer) domain-containing protein
MPCVLLTASEDAADELTALEAGADVYLRKTASFDVLGARLAALLRATSPRTFGADASGGRKILAIDDSATFLNALTEQLRGDGYDIAPAHSGEEALELLPLERIDAILLDLLMPGLSGEDTCRRIKAHPDWRHIPVLMLTSSDDQGSVIAGLSAGADDYIAKSESFDVIRARLRAQLRRKHFEDENRRILSQLARKEFEAAEAQAARAAAEARARLVADLEAKNAELEQARAEAEQATRAKAAFLATMSHEIRTPLNAVIGISELLRSAAHDERQKNLLGIVQTSGSHLLSIINDILDFSKIDAGKLELDSRPFELRRCVEEALELVTHKAAEKSLDLAYVYDEDVPEGFVGDGNRVRQVLVNYLSNAVKFTERGEVVVNVVAEALESDECQIVFAVRDTGVGIPVERQEQLFEPFAQVDAVPTRRFGGTGLGLAICRRLAGMMGGRTWVDSAEGQGSTFYFTIKGQSAELPRPQPKSVTSLTGLRVLVVDDNVINRCLLSAAAKSWGMQVRETGSPLEALQWIRDGEAFDLAFIDHLMPELDGSVLAREIHKIRSLPLVLVSSITGGFASGEFVAALAKPIRQSTLFDTVQDIVNHHLRSVAAAPKLQSPESTVQFSNLRILLVEDNPVNQQVAVLMLESLGCVADVAANGRDAVAAAERSHYDLILMDVQMPVMDGLEATRQMRMRLPPERRPRIVAMTAGAFDSDREQCLQAGMDDFAPKPIQRHRLAEVLRSVVARKEKGSRKAPAPAGDESSQPTAPSPAGAPAAEVDPKALTELSASLGSEGIRDVVSTLIRDAPGMLDDLLRAADAGDADKTRRFIHTLRSNCAIAGADDLAAQCLEIERQLVSGGIGDSNERIEQVAARYRKATDELLTIQRERGW